MTATTALTAQNTQGVQDIHHTPPAFLKKQLDAVCDDVGVDVVKTGTVEEVVEFQELTLHTGMLASAETIEIVADAFRRYGVRMSVVDPVGYVNTVLTHVGSHLQKLMYLAGYGIDIRFTPAPGVSYLHLDHQVATSHYHSHTESARG